MTTTAGRPFRASRYTTGAIALHWAIAALIFAQLAGGFAMTRLLREGTALQFDLYQLHKSLGVTVLILTVARVLWRLFNPPPPEPASVGRIEATAAHTVHMAFYGLLVLIPLSGWLIVTVSPVQIATVLFFTDWLPWPHLPGFGSLSQEARTDLAHASELVHMWLAYGMAFLLVLHVAGALKHHLADGSYLTRMSPLARGKGPRKAHGRAMTAAVTVAVFGALVGAATIARQEGPVLAADGASGAQEASAPGAAEGPGEAEAAAATEEAGAPAWTLDPAASTLTFTATYRGSDVEGGFRDFTADIRFDPENLEASSIDVAIDTTTAYIDSSEISRQNLAGSDGFANREHGTARFVSDTIDKDGDRYRAHGTLTIRGRAVEQSLPFTLDIEDGRARAQGELVIDRFDYGIGEENDPGADWVGRDVTVRLSVAADRADRSVASAQATGAPATAAPGRASASGGAGDGGKAPKWRILTGESEITYAFRFEDATVSGTIPVFEAAVRFDENNLDGSSIAAEIDLSSVTVEGADISGSQLKGSNGLAVSQQRYARFRADTVERAEDGGFLARGTLSVRGIAQEITLPFTLSSEDGRTVADARVALERSAYGFGEGAPVSEDALDPTVEVRLTIVAEPPRPDLTR